MDSPPNFTKNIKTYWW